MLYGIYKIKHQIQLVHHQVIMRNELCIAVNLKRLKMCWNIVIAQSG